jgi:hypothetical protein
VAVDSGSFQAPPSILSQHDLTLSDQLKAMMFSAGYLLGGGSLQGHCLFQREIHIIWGILEKTQAPSIVIFAENQHLVVGPPTWGWQLGSVGKVCTNHPIQLFITHHTEKGTSK